jgi:hypothetical protein
MSETQNNIPTSNDVNDNATNDIENKNITNEFCKIIGEFVPDLFNTFPECKEDVHPGIIVALEHAQFMKEHHKNNCAEDDDDDKNELISSENVENNEDFQELMDSCKQVYPARFFDILYQNDEIFSNSEIDTHFLPNINFSELWTQDISDKTREVIWKYLQLILLALMPTINDGNSFGDTAKLFEAIDEEEFKKKLEETVESMNSMFNFDGESNNDDENNSSQTDGSSNPINLENLPNADELHSHINGMLGGKLGKLAQEIAEETANELDIDLENATNVNDVFKKLFKNPGKLMSMVKNIGGKLESKIKSGEISETELMKEASSMMGEMHKMPGMNNIKSMLQQFGLPTGKGKFNMNAFQSHMNQNIKGSQQRERMLKKLEQRKKERGGENDNNNEVQPLSSSNVFSKGEAPQKSTRADKPKNSKPKNNKGKRKKNKNKK